MALFPVSWRGWRLVDQPAEISEGNEMGCVKVASSAAARISLLCVVGFLFVSVADGQIVKQGVGSYTTTRPASCKPLPTIIYKTSDVNGATPSNQWWSSLVWEPRSQNMFPHPLGMVCSEKGLSIGYPGAAIVAASGNIMGGGISENGDIVIGHSAESSFPDAKLADNSQWFITAEFASNEAALRTTFGHGSPFIYCRLKRGKPVLSFAETPQVWSGSTKEAILGITVRGNHYGLFGASASTWSGLKTSTFENETTKDYFSVALLPDNDPETLALFAKYAHNHVIDTRLEHSVDNGYAEGTYKFSTQAMEGNESGTIFALYPHQWKYSEVNPTSKTYRSVRGQMKVAIGSEFTTRVPIQGVLPMLPKEGIPNREQMLEYLRKEAADNKNDGKYGDTYYEGKQLGKLATLSGIAEQSGDQKLQNQFQCELKSRLENWFTASEDEDAPQFYYDKRWGAMIGCRPSFGSDKELNDHHFHYGYFVRAAAEIARQDPEWARAWGPMVELLIRDMASPDQDDAMFPHLRCFDVYAGHSWASGHAKFGDGNNQESSSESLNAWYGMMLWGAATGDTRLRDLGTFLYNTERTAVEEYWFDVAETNFPDDYPNVAVGMVWGGKGAFATWFSGKIDHIHGINWLPFTPASMYMGRHPGYVKKNHDRVVEKRKHGNDYNRGWGDLLVMFGSLHDPAIGVKFLENTPDCKVESGNSQAFMYHWIHTLDRMGTVDPDVTADHPFTNVYTKDGKRTYAAYNFRNTPMNVTFSDGQSLEVKPNGLTVKQ